MKSLGRISFASAIFFIATFSRFAIGAQDASIEQLLKKLPPPEKLVKPSVERALGQQDPALRDSMVNDIAAAWRSRNIPRALELSRRLAIRYPRSAGSQCLQGVLALELRQYREAAVAFHHSIAIQPTFALSHFGLAVTEGAQGRFSAAMPHLLQLTRLEPNSPVAWQALSDCAQRLGRKEESLTYAKRAATVAPASIGTWLQLARAENALGHTDGTLNALTRAAEVSPDSASILSLVGYSYINLNRLPQAIPPLQRAARLAPKDFLVQSQLGYCLQATGQLDAGITHLRLGASLAPKNYGPVWEHLGVAYQKKGLHRDAVKAFERATQIMPGYRPCWQHLAEEYRALGRMPEASRATTRAQSLPSAPSQSRSRKR
jgi:tetratricopeptide (TPR) repeat protein